MTIDIQKLPPVQAVDACRFDAIPEEVLSSRQPLVLRGLIAGWPAVPACRTVSSTAAYFANFWQDKQLMVYVADESIDGRFFYNEDFTGFNYRSGRSTLQQVMAKLAEADRPPEEASIYVGSTPVDDYLPGFRAENDLALEAHSPLASFWLGSATRVSAHFDFPDNIACVVSGRREVTLFPPEQLANLYIGPLEMTPAGQPISLVDFKRPDWQAHPRFKEALGEAQRCSLEPGDAIFIPGMWWHHIEATEDFNLLVNYWWRQSSMFLGAPFTALLHAILSVRDLPPPLRQAWQGLFKHYVFEPEEGAQDHIPERARGCLAPFTDNSARQLRAELLNRLNR